MWTIFNVFIEFVTLLLLFYVLVFWPRGMWDLSSPTRNRTRTPCIGRQSLNRWTVREVQGDLVWSVNYISSYGLEVVEIFIALVSIGNSCHDVKPRVIQPAFLGTAKSMNPLPSEVPLPLHSGTVPLGSGLAIRNKPLSPSQHWECFRFAPPGLVAFTSPLQTLSSIPSLFGDGSLDPSWFHFKEPLKI